MNKIGFVVALLDETNDLRKELKVLKEEKVGGCLVYTIKNNNTSSYLIYSGVGKANAAHATSILINKYKVNIVINIGSACSINKGYEISDICVVSSSIYGDVDVCVFGYEKNQLPHEPLEFLTTNELNQKIIKLIDIKNHNIHTDCYLSTTDCFIDKHNFKKFDFHKSTDLIDMEGTAIGQICSKYSNVKHAIIKVVSDVYNKKVTSSKQWTENSVLFKNIISKIIKSIIN